MVQCHGVEANPIAYIWSKYECFLISVCQDIIWSCEKLNHKCDANANIHGDYNSSDAVEVKSLFLKDGLIKNQLVGLIEDTFRREVLYLACNQERAFFASEELKQVAQRATISHLTANIFK